MELERTNEFSTNLNTYMTKFMRQILWKYWGPAFKIFRLSLRQLLKTLKIQTLDIFYKYIIILNRYMSDILDIDNN